MNRDLHHELEQLMIWADRDTEDTIRDTVSKLPPGVRHFAISNLAYAWAGVEGPAQLLPPTGRWLVVLTDNQPESTIAHEIAHAWLGHVPVSDGEYDDQEARARELVRLWGFTGVGADEPPA